MICKIYCGVPGSGKTLSMLDEIATTPGRHIVAAPRMELDEEFCGHVREKQRAGGIVAHVEAIHSGQTTSRGSVKRRIEDALRDEVNGAHRALFVTHEGLLGIDLALFEGWHVRIDEVPEGAILSGAFSAATSFGALDHFYDLQPLHDGSPWCLVVPRDSVDPPKPSEYRTDAGGLADFHKAVANRQRSVFVDLSVWQDARARNRLVHWWSIWTPTNLWSCASLGITGAGFFRSMLYRACRFIHGDRLVFEKVDPPASVSRARPRVSIHYYTRHSGSTTWWETHDGTRCLVRISEHLQRIGFEGYWSCNKDIKLAFLHRFGGDAVEPRQAGTNSLRHHRACAYIYSNKAQPADRVLLDLLDLDDVAVSIAREQEDIIQFVMRGAIRDPHFDGDYNIHLYSQDQAEALRDYLVTEGITDRVELHLVVEAGIMDVARPEKKGGQTTISSTKVSVREREERRKANDRERSQRLRDEKRAARKAEGTYRGRGRPRKIEVADPPAA